MPYPPNFAGVWDITQPPDTQPANQLGLDLRTLRNDIMQRMSLLSGLLVNRPTPETVNANWGGTGYGLMFFATDTQQIFQWNGAAWNQIFNIAGTHSVASVDLLTQTFGLGSTPIYTPVSAGFYKLCVEMFCFAGVSGTTASFQFTVQWRQNAKLPSQTFSATIPVNQAGAISQVVPLYSDAGQAINYSTFAAVLASGYYDLHLRLEAV